jgi:hypothetical protein
LVGSRSLTRLRSSAGDRGSNSHDVLVANLVVDLSYVRVTQVRYGRWSNSRSERQSQSQYAPGAEGQAGSHSSTLSGRTIVGMVLLRCSFAALACPAMRPERSRLPAARGPWTAQTTGAYTQLTVGGVSAGVLWGPTSSSPLFLNCLINRFGAQTDFGQ